MSLLSRNIGLDLVRATEAAALAASRWVGSGEPISAEMAAYKAVSEVLDELPINGRIVIGEENFLKKHTSLDSGLAVGTGEGPQVDVIVDPIDGAKLLVRGSSGAVSMIGVAPKDSMWAPPPVALHMDKIIVDQHTASALVPECLEAPAAWTIALVARAKNKPVHQVMVSLLNRPRHRDLIDEIRASGARIFLRTEGDAEGALMAAMPDSGIDIWFGVGGVPQGIITACGVKALGGAMLGRLKPQSQSEYEAVLDAGLSTNRIMTQDDIIIGDELFFATTAITTTPILPPVRYHNDYAETHSFLLRGASGTRRYIHAQHWGISFQTP
ncbi:MAG TPA: fructose-bisphosphatase class II [Anaerolineae bacterium]|nr:fructose-bisphosphatase class II [Anaerolineae bacterium]